MKLNKYSIFGMALGIAALLSSCQTDYDAPGLDDNKATMTANTTIMELKSILEGKSSIKIGMKDEESATPYIIKGRVISSDISGNIFKSLVIQDQTGAISFSINQGNLYTNYRVGQEVIVKATGLWGGTYHDLICLGAGANEYGSLVTSRMSFAAFKENSELSGLPNENMKYIPMGADHPADYPYTIVVNNIASLPASGEDLYAMQSQLVEIPNVYFEDADGTTPYALKDENVNRNIVDANGGTLAVRNSGYSNFYNTPLPTGTGTVRGILSYYGGSWQLLLRDLSDVLFDGEGSKEKPYTVEEVIGMDNNGRTAWAQGYIVGSVKAGVSSVTSNDDIIFGADADLDNTLVIAGDPDVKDYTKCLVVALPSGSKFREYANLTDNPRYYGKHLALAGTFSQYLGMNGVVNNGGTLSDFILEDLFIPGVTGEGTGTLGDPYTVTYILANPDAQNGVYVQGYIVGFVAGRNFLNGAVFGKYTNEDYNNGNVIIAASPEINDVQKAIPVRLGSIEMQNAIGIKANPAAIGTKVRFKGNVGSYLGTVGLANTESFAIVQ
ncbi:MAG: DUF5689 domain-containing protein [Muribaculum sp.]|nr:DUF5689 domain-containing protein [Muribaculum sp.]